MLSPEGDGDVEDTDAEVDVEADVGMRVTEETMVASVDGDWVVEGKIGDVGGLDGVDDGVDAGRVDDGAGPPAGEDGEGGGAPPAPHNSPCEVP